MIQSHLLFKVNCSWWPWSSLSLSWALNTAFISMLHQYFHAVYIYNITTITNCSTTKCKSRGEKNNNRHLFTLISRKPQWKRRFSTGYGRSHSQFIEQHDERLYSLFVFYFLPIWSFSAPSGVCWPNMFYVCVPTCYFSDSLETMQFMWKNLKQSSKPSFDSFR